TTDVDAVLAKMAANYAAHEVDTLTALKSTSTKNGCTSERVILSPLFVFTQSPKMKVLPMH
ncbi:MAG: hypothetical protein RL078_1609, partial [Bacteroidota bacterium]